MKLALLFVILLVSAQAFNWKEFSQNIENKVNRSNTTWKAGYNPRFENMSLDEIKYLMGTYEAPPNQIPATKEFSAEEIAALDLPENFDPREQWPNCESIREIRDQSNCGSCWAFGTVEAISDRICIASGQKEQTRISSENLLSCCRGIFACGQGCNGGYTEAAWGYFVKTGLVTGNLYGQNQYCQPYAFPPCSHHVQGEYPPCEGTEKTPKCVEQCNDDYEGPQYKDDLHFGNSHYSLKRNEQDIMAELYKYGSATASFTVYDDFLTYKSGVYEHTGGGFPMGGHAVKILGWGVEDGTPYWLCANSWNNSWGDNGFFKILRGVNECGIEQGIVAGLVEGQN